MSLFSIKNCSLQILTINLKFTVYLLDSMSQKVAIGKKDPSSYNFARLWMKYYKKCT